VDRFMGFCVLSKEPPHSLSKESQLRIHSWVSHIHSFSTASIIFGFAHVSRNLVCIIVRCVVLWAWFELGGCTRYRTWFRHCATRRKVGDSISGRVFEIFHSFNHSGSNMSLGSTQPLTEINTMDLLGEGRGVNCRGLTTLSPSYTDYLKILGASYSWTPRGPPRPYRGRFTFDSNFKKYFELLLI
jgi:hypothetical protein